LNNIIAVLTIRTNDLQVKGTFYKSATVA
jgi:hypothetical protein